MIPNWMRKLPHFDLKPCGGADADCSLMPEAEARKLNWLQQAFWRHDRMCRIGKQLIDKGKKILDRADRSLADDLRAGKMKGLKLKEKYYLLKARLVFFRGKKKK